jgi:hypothetical protein
MERVKREPKAPKPPKAAKPKVVKVAKPPKAPKPPKPPKKVKPEAQPEAGGTVFVPAPPPELVDGPVAEHLPPGELPDPLAVMLPGGVSLQPAVDVVVLPEPEAGDAEGLLEHALATLGGPAAGNAWLKEAAKRGVDQAAFYAGRRTLLKGGRVVAVKQDGSKPLYAVKA